MRRRWGRVVGVTSVVGFTGNPGQANYAASKAGMGTCQVARRASNARGQVQVQQEILAQRLARRQAVARDDLAQRGQGGDGAAQACRAGRWACLGDQSRTSTKAAARRSRR